MLLLISYYLVFRNYFSAQSFAITSTCFKTVSVALSCLSGGYKRKYGGYTLAKSIQAIKAEAYCKAIA